MSEFQVEVSKRIKTLPPYLFAKIDEMKEEVKKRGVDIIDLGVGDPDMPTPEHIIKRLQSASEKPENHKYPSYVGMLQYRESVANFYKKRFNVSLNPETEIISLIGSKEGIAHFPYAFIDSGDYALVPEPGYPVYAIATKFAGGEVHYMPLLEKNGFLPDLKEIPEDIAKKAKIMFINYPNNPTGAVANEKFFKDVISFAKKYNVIVVHDAAYTEMYYDGIAPLSFLGVEGAMEVGVELHSLSKTYNMTGWRIGWAAGRKEIVGALGKIKTNIDSGAFQAIQEAAMEALDSGQKCVEDMRQMYQERRDVLISGLKKLGFTVNSPLATFYIWINVPKGYSSADFTALLLKEAGIVTTPGNGFGPSGEGYIRMALTVDKDRLNEAVERIENIKEKIFK
jgi:LL-diaminopimelate aminotransferase